MGKKKKSKKNGFNSIWEGLFDSFEEDPTPTKKSGKKTISTEKSIPKIANEGSIRKEIIKSKKEYTGDVDYQKLIWLVNAYSQYISNDVLRSITISEDEYKISENETSREKCSLWHALKYMNERNMFKNEAKEEKEILEDIIGKDKFEIVFKAFNDALKHKENTVSFNTMNSLTKLGLL